MPSVTRLGMLEAGDFNEPVTYRYEVVTPFGRMAQELSVDIRILINKAEYVPAIGSALWAALIAPAISRDVRLDLLWYVRWRQGGLALPFVPAQSHRGNQSGTSAGRAHTAIAIFHTGHSDNLAARRFYLHATPVRWQTDTMLNDRGWDGMLPWAQAVSMSLAGDALGGDFQQIVAYPWIVEPYIGNLFGVGFRKVTHIKVLQYTDKCPDFDGGVWP